MKTANNVLVIILLIASGCVGNRIMYSDEVLVNVTARFPQKELILQDFMDVEYIVLETNREFLNQGNVRAIGRDFIIVTNRVNDGYIFIYDRNGKALRKINRLGHGGEEYISILGIVLDEDNNEIFVNDVFASRVLVYDLYGNFKRSFLHREGTMVTKMFNFDRNNLICYDDSWEKSGNTFFIISKHDGSVIKEIEIPFGQVVLTRIQHSDDFMTGPRWSPIVAYRGNWVLVEPSSNTMFKYFPDHSMVPLIVRTPSIQSMNPEVFLFPDILTDRYYFMRSVKKEFNPETRRGFPATNLVYDKQGMTIFEVTVLNGDYSGNRRPVIMFGDPINNEIALWQRLEADHLYEFYREGRLVGKLKEAASRLEEEDNPVIMLVMHRR